MAKHQKTKLCWNCEGRVSVSAETCPFCGVSVIPASLDPTPSSFSPPYRMGGLQDNSIPRSPYASVPVDNRNLDEEQEDFEEEEYQEASSRPKEIAKEQPTIDDFKEILLSTTLLLSGSVFFLFGLVLVVFSHQGVFTLQWDGSVWFIYIGLAVPLLFFGWRSLNKLDENKS